MSSYARKAAQAFGSRAGGYLREGYGGVNVEKIITFALLGVGLYVGYKIYTAGSAAKKAIVSARDYVSHAIGNGLYDLFHPNDGVITGSYNVYFPDENVFRQIDVNTVDGDGGFAIKGKFYDIVKLKTIVTLPHPVTGQPWPYDKVAKRVL